MWVPWEGMGVECEPARVGNLEAFQRVFRYGDCPRYLVLEWLRQVHGGLLCEDSLKHVLGVSALNGWLCI